MVCGQDYNARARMPLTTHTNSIQANRGRTGAGLHLLRQNYNAIVPALNAEQLRLPRDRIRHGLGFLAQTLETQHRDSRRFVKLIFMLFNAITTFMTFMMKTCLFKENMTVLLLE